MVEVSDRVQKVGHFGEEFNDFGNQPSTLRPLLSSSVLTIFMVTNGSL